MNIKNSGQWIKVKLGFMIVLIGFGCGKISPLRTAQVVQKNGDAQKSNDAQKTFSLDDEKHINSSPVPSPSPLSSSYPSPSSSPSPWEKESPIDPDGGTVDENTPPQYEDVIRIMGKTGAGSGEIELYMAFPSNTSAYRSVVLARLQGSSPPNTKCTDGVRSSITPETGKLISATPSSQGEVYSFRLCVTDITGFVHSNLVLHSIRSRPASAPSCSIEFSDSSISVGESVTISLSTSASTLRKSISGLSSISLTDTLVAVAGAPGSYEFVGSVSNELGSSECRANLSVQNISNPPPTNPKSVTMTCGPYNGCPIIIGDAKCYCRAPITGRITDVKVVYEIIYLFNTNPICEKGSTYSFDDRSIIVDPNRCAAKFEVFYE